MVEDVFVVIALPTDEHVREQPAEVLAELEQVENLHCLGGFGQGGGIEDQVHARSLAAEPGREEAGVLDQQVGGDGANQVVESGVRPFN